MAKIVMTGGGTAGHVTPNIALIPKLKDEGVEVYYIGTHDGIEKKLIKEIKIPYYEISSGKLRRYLDKKNISDIFKVIRGCSQAKKVIKKIKPNVVFSKGGFVAVPVVIGAWLNKIPVIIHESDMTPGLANKIAIPFASRICTAFEETINYVPKQKAVFTGTPIREELCNGNKEKILKKFNHNKPILLIMGGSQGSVKINDIIRQCLNEILMDFNVIHICGKNNLSNINTDGYIQFEYVSSELADIYAATDLIISRAGANSISEYLALKKPSLLIPLSTHASRGDQILNAKSFSEKGYALYLDENELNKETLLKNLRALYKNKQVFIINMQKQTINNPRAKIINILKKYL